MRELPQAVWPLRRKLLEQQDADQSPEVRARRVYYLQVGSCNMNNRSMLIDGEAALTVSGPAALTGLIDFLMVTGLSTWVETQEQIDALIPRRRPPSNDPRDFPEVAAFVVRSFSSSFAVRRSSFPRDRGPSPTTTRAARAARPRPPRWPPGRPCSPPSRASAGSSRSPPRDRCDSRRGRPSERR